MISILADPAGCSAKALPAKRARQYLSSARKRLAIALRRRQRRLRALLLVALLKRRDACKGRANCRMGLPAGDRCRRRSQHPSRPDHCVIGRDQPIDQRFHGRAFFRGEELPWAWLDDLGGRACMGIPGGQAVQFHGIALPEEKEEGGGGGTSEQIATSCTTRSVIHGRPPCEPTRERSAGDKVSCRHRNVISLRDRARWRSRSAGDDHSDEQYPLERFDRRVRRNVRL